MAILGMFGTTIPLGTILNQAAQDNKPLVIHGNKKKMYHIMLFWTKQTICFLAHAMLNIIRLYVFLYFWECSSKGIVRREKVKHHFQNRIITQKLLSRKMQCSTASNNTKHIHNTQQLTWAAAALLSSGFAPLSPWAGQSCPQIIALLLPYKCAQVASHWAGAHRRQFTCLGRQNRNHWKRESKTGLLMNMPN